MRNVKLGTMDARSNTEIELLLKRLDVVKIDLTTIKERQQTILDGMSEADPCSDEVTNQESIVEDLEDAIYYFEKALECLSSATY